MLIRVREGAYDPNGDPDREETLKPKGRELWSGGAEDLTAAALHAAVSVDPGTWYNLPEFRQLVAAAAKVSNEGGVFSTVRAPQPGVGKPWVAIMEVSEGIAALMLCRSVIRHVEKLAGEDEVWIRVE